MLVRVNALTSRLHANDSYVFVLNKWMEHACQTMLKVKSTSSM